MSPLPTHMRDRWQNRADTPPGKGTVYWHILMGGYPEVRSRAQKAQDQLANFSGLHMTPLDWLHMSVLVVGTTDEVTSDQMKKMVDLASLSLSNAPPIKVTLGRVLYHPEAIMLGIEEEGALDPILNAAKTATTCIAGREGYTTSGPGSWLPHMTLCYSTSKQAAEPLIHTLGVKLPVCEIIIDTLTLVVQWGPERQWHWEPVGSALLSG